MRPDCALRSGEEHKGDWQPLISDETFGRVQKLFGRQPKVRKVAAHPDFPLRRFVRCGRCEKPLTGSRSTGRTGRYCYYHCAKCGKVRTSKLLLEQAYIGLLERLQLRNPFQRLFRAIVVDCWTNQRTQTRDLKADIEKRIEALNADLSALEQAFLFKRTIDGATYRSQLQRLRDEITGAQCELSDARFDELEIEGVLSFAEYVLSNLASLWSAANVSDRIRLQETMFPTGLVWDGERFGTALTNGAFSWLG